MASPPFDKMKAPSDRRPGIWRDGVLQIKVTNACDLDCRHCSVGVGLARKLKRVFFMTPDQFRTALRSLEAYDGVIGMFGGNPCIHPQFEELCRIFREEVPDKDQRGLWSNNLRGHGWMCRETFSAQHSNLNVHGVREAWDEIRRDWPEARPLQAGLSEPSMHGPIFGSMMDVGLTEEEMWERVGTCYVNQTWSAEITVVGGRLVGYFCEIAATMAELEGDPSFGMDVGMDVGVGGPWWKEPLWDLQVRKYCSRCLVPLNARKIRDSSSEPEQYTVAWRPLMLTVHGRAMQEATSFEADDRPATKYLSKGVMRKETR